MNRAAVEARIEAASENVFDMLCEAQARGVPSERIAEIHHSACALIWYHKRSGGRRSAYWASITLRRYARHA